MRLLSPRAGEVNSALPSGFSPASISCAARLQERRQRQRLAERVQRLVGGEAGAVGGDLEQDAVRLAEIEAAEIEAVDLAAVGDAQLVEPLGPGVVLRASGVRKAT